MKIQLLKYSPLLLLFMFFGCNQTAKHEKQEKLIATNQIRHAKGFELHNYNGYSVLKVNTPWPNSKDSFTYILKEKNGVIPDSLLQYASISVPIQTIVVTSTTHIPPLELLEAAKQVITGCLHFPQSTRQPQGAMIIFFCFSSCNFQFSCGRICSGLMFGLSSSAPIAGVSIIPPRPEALIYGILKLHEKIGREKLVEGE